MPHPFTVLVTHALRNIVRPPPGGVTYEKVEEELYSERQERQRQKVKAKRCAPPMHSAVPSMFCAHCRQAQDMRLLVPQFSGHQRVALRGVA